MPPHKRACKATEGWFANQLGYLEEAIIAGCWWWTGELLGCIKVCRYLGTFQAATAAMRHTMTHVPTAAIYLPVCSLELVLGGRKPRGCGGGYGADDLLSGTPINGILISIRGGIAPQGLGSA